VVFFASGLSFSACTSFGSGDNVSDGGPSGNGNGPDGGPGTLDGTLPAQKLNVQLDPAKATVARKGGTLIKVAIAVGGTSAAVRLEAPPGSGLTAAPQVANGTGAAVLEIKASDKAETKAQKVRIVVEGVDGVSRGEATLDLEVRGAPGELDEGWGVGGILDLGGANDLVDAAVLPSGDILVARNFGPTVSYIQRVLAAGAIDTAFGPNGRCPVVGAERGLSIITRFGQETYVAGEGSAGASLYRIDTPCAVTRQYIAPTAKLTGITGIFGTTTPLLGGYSDSSWTLVKLSRHAINELVPNASWGASGYASGTPFGGVYGLFEGPSKDLLITSEGGTNEFSLQSMSKEGFLVGQGVRNQGSFAGGIVADGEFAPVSIQSIDPPSFSVHLPSGTKTTRVPFREVLPSSSGRTAIGVLEGGVVAFGEGQGNNVLPAGVVSLVRFGMAGDLVPGFGTNGVSTVRRLGVQAVTDVRRVLAFGDKVYVLASISYSQTPGGPRDRHEVFLARVWL
jgi:hypothetical protein